MAIEEKQPHPHSYRERSYRGLVGDGGLSFAVRIEESDLWINILQPEDKIDWESLTSERLLHYRTQLKAFLQRYPDWGSSLSPVPAADYPFAPSLVRGMMTASSLAQVGPMAAVAGALAEVVGRDLSRHAAGVVVENGGDIFLTGKREYRLAIFAGTSPLSSRLGIKIENSRPFSCGVCTSSGRVGHSLSMGLADAVTIVAESGALADAVATATANTVQLKNDLPVAVEKALAIEGVSGAVAVCGDGCAAGGQLELINL